MKITIPISDALRKAIRSAGCSRYALSAETKVAESVLSRFMSGRFDLSLWNADRLAAFFGLELVPKGRRPKKGRCGRGKHLP